MTSAVLDIKRWGNNLGVRLPVLEQRLARLEPARHGGEVMETMPVGAEQWWRKRPIGCRRAAM